MENTPETSPETIDTSLDPPVETHRNKNKKLILTPEMKADPISKKLIFLSLLFAGLAAICIGFLTFVYYQKKHAGHPTEVQEAPHKPILVITQNLDQIQVKLKNDQDLRVEIAAECSQRETCDYIKDNPAKVRDLLIPILTSIDADLFSNIENKKLIRKKLSDRMNSMEMPGKVIQVHFNNLSIEGNPQ